VECGLDRFYTPGKKAEYIARDALDRIASEGIKQKLSYLLITAGPEHGIRNQWKVLNDKKDPVGFVTSIAYSQLHKGIIAFAYIDTEHLDQQGELFAETEEQACLPAALCNRNWERI
jgi:glycine cleavage system aminomethyltransferase T